MQKEEETEKKKLSRSKREKTAIHEKANFVTQIMDTQQTIVT